MRNGRRLEEKKGTLGEKTLWDPGWCAGAKLLPERDAEYRGDSGASTMDLHISFPATYLNF